MKAQYTKYTNINLNGYRAKQLEKYQLRKNIKLVTKDIKIALMTFPVSLLIGATLEQNSVESNCIYIVSGCALTYAITNLYLHKKEKQKKFTLRWAF